MTLNQAKSINANTNASGTVSFKAGRGFRFGSKAANDSAVLLAA